MQAETLEMKKTINGNEVRFTIKGRISSSTSYKFSNELKAALFLGQNKIILDMSDVQFLSSLGIRSILSTYKQTQATGGQFYIVNPSTHVQNVLGMAALNAMLLEER